LNAWEKIAQDWAADLKAKRGEGSGLMQNLSKMRDNLPTQTVQLAQDRSDFLKGFEEYNKQYPDPPGGMERWLKDHPGKTRADFDKAGLLEYIWEKRFGDADINGEDAVFQAVPYPLYDPEEWDQMMYGKGDGTDSSPWGFISEERKRFLKDQQEKSYEPGYIPPKDFFDIFMENMDDYQE